MVHSIRFYISDFEGNYGNKAKRQDHCWRDGTDPVWIFNRKYCEKWWYGFCLRAQKTCTVSENKCGKHERWYFYEWIWVVCKRPVSVTGAVSCIKDSVFHVCAGAERPAWTLYQRWLYCQNGISASCGFTAVCRHAFWGSLWSLPFGYRHRYLSGDRAG